MAPGDRVSAGQPLCESGDAGFCPTPHLHLQLQEGEEDSAPTVLFALLDHEGNPYFPVAGKWYGSRGEMDALSGGRGGELGELVESGAHVRKGEAPDERGLDGVGSCEDRCGTHVSPPSR